MGRPKKATTAGRKALAKKDANVVVLKPVEANVVDEAEDFEEQLRIVNLICNAVDQEVESRSAAIMAIGDGHMASATTQLQLLISKFPEHIRKMPMKKFLKEHCPNTRANTRPDGTIYFDLMEEDTEAFTMGGIQPPGGGILNFNNLNFNAGFAQGFGTVRNTPGFGTVRNTPGFGTVRNTPGFGTVRNTPGFGALRNTPGFASVQNTPGFGPSQSMTDYIGEGVSNKLADQKGIEQYSWDEFLTAYRMQSAMKGPSGWDTPSIRTPGMNWRDTMITRNFTPMTEKVFPSVLPSQTGKTRGEGAKRKATTSRGLRM